MTSLSSTTRITIGAGIAGSAVANILGLAWLVLPGDGFFYANSFNALLAAVAGPGTALLVHAVAAVLGIAVGIAALAGLLAPRGIVIGSASQVLVFGLLLQSAATLNVVGYLVALAMPVIGLVLLAQLFRRSPRARWAAGVPILLAAGVLVVLGRDPIGRLAGTLATRLLPELPTMSIMLLFVGIGASWAAAAATAVADTSAARRATAWVIRHRTVFTVIAACCPLPYAIIRLTWLTPWPLLGGVGLETELRIWGLLLSSGAWLGAVLTIGLIRGWGEVFPRWVPLLAGRRVPITAAALPGGLVAATLCFVAVPWLHAAGSNIPDPTISGLLKAGASVVFFPCWLWGPTLALAVWGYVGRRRRTEQDAIAEQTRAA